MKNQTRYFFLAVFCILICFACSKAHNEPEPPFYGTMSAKVDGILTREFIPPVPVTNNQGIYELYGNEGVTGNLRIRISVPAFIFSEGSYTLQDGITASLSGGSGYGVWTKVATEASIMINLMTDQKVKGTFYFSSTDPLNEFEVTDGRFDLVRE